LAVKNEDEQKQTFQVQHYLKKTSTRDSHIGVAVIKSLISV